MRRILDHCFSQAIVSTFVVATACALGCSEAVHQPATADKQPAAAEAGAEAVDVIEVGRRPWPHVVRTQGTLIEDEIAVLGAKVAGRVKEVLVDLGMPVQAGQVVARLDTEEFDLKVQQAEAQVAQARAIVGLKGDTPDNQLDPAKAAPVVQEAALVQDARLNVQRVRDKASKGAFTQEEIQTRETALQVAEARYRSALNAVNEQIAVLGLRRAELALALRNREDAVLTAPFDGVIQERRVAPGSYVTIGQGVATLVRIDPVRFRAGVPERSAAGVAVGQPVRVLLEGQPAMEIKIARISPSLDVANRTLIVEADLENSAGRWRTGMFAEGEIIVDTEQTALAVPVTSVVAFGGIEKVWTVTGNQAAPRPIRTGRRDNDFVEVLDGLQAGDLVIANGRQGRQGVVQVRREGAEVAGDRAASLGQ